uniref:Uncharacterized protein n=1 Tax=Tanacetum cinerariifolium TaxID=118510 RepID=A0A699VW68_TANCI|nr:hypothetical protein [Tanacetum cinerariifolium]
MRRSVRSRSEALVALTQIFKVPGVTTNTTATAALFAKPVHISPLRNSMDYACSKRKENSPGSTRGRLWGNSRYRDKYEDLRCGSDRGP